MLTAENLFDGTISTNTEHFYIEPAHKYSMELPKSGVHSIIYKLSDVKMNINNNRDDIDTSLNEHEPHCASEKLFRKLQKENNLLKKATSESRLSNKLNNVNEKSEINLKQWKPKDDVLSSRQGDNRKNKPDVVRRFKRWLTEEEVSLDNSLRHNVICLTKPKRRFPFLRKASLPGELCNFSVLLRHLSLKKSCHAANQNYEFTLTTNWFCLRLRICQNSLTSIDVTVNNESGIFKLKSRSSTL